MRVEFSRSDLGRRALLAGAAVFAFSAPVQAADGEAGWAGLGLAALVALSGGLFLGLLGALRAKRTLEDRVRSLERRAKVSEALLDVAPTAWLVWPVNGATERASPNLAALVGLSSGAAAGLGGVLSRLTAEDASALNAAVEGLRARGERFELSLMAADGKRAYAAEGLRVVGMDAVWLRSTSEVSAARAELSQLRDRFARVLDALPIPVWLRDSNLVVATANREFARAVDAPNVVAAAGVELLPGAAGRAMAAQARTDGRAQTTRTHAVVAGSRRLLGVTEQGLDDAGGVIGFALDYTDVEEAEAERDRHIAAHREVLERLALPIVVYGADMRVRFFNRAYLHAWQFEESWLEAGPTVTEVIDRLRERRLIPEAADFPAYKREKIRQFTSLLEPVEEFLHLPDGRAIRLTTAPHPLGGLIHTFEDLTDRLALERSYNTLIAVQRETLDNLYEGIAVFGGDGRLKLWNPAFARMWGLGADALAGEPHVTELMARTVRFFRGENGAAADREDLLDAVLDRTPVNRRLERADGTVLDYAKVPLPDGATLLSFIDVTDRLRVETALRERTEALEAADRLKSEFIANVSYELRTPLNAIVGFAEILNNQYFGALNDRQGEYVRGIIQASNRLLALINDILDLAMIEAGRMTLETDQVDVHAMMVSVFNLSRDWARKQNQRIEFDCPGDIGQIVADERRLKQALFNLISNAVKFTPAGGRLRVSARREGESLAFTVTDTGIGIPPEQHGEVFEKFARGKDGSGRYQGVGLGLALVRHIVELHGGSVAITSTPNEGTEVTCRVPVAGAAEQPARAVPTLAASADGPAATGLARTA